MTSTKQIVDRFGRIHDYLRISLTERCNLRCTYCMPEEGITLRDKVEFMSSEELLSIARTFVEMGVKKIRLTGGEPLVKKDIAHILRELGKLPVELAITTNGVVADKYIEDMWVAGIRQINVSLDSLNENRFHSITRRDYFHRVMHNIDLLILRGFTVKINVVVMRGVNDDEIPAFVEWTKHQAVHVRFIEFMPFDGNQWRWEQKVSQKEIMQRVNAHFDQSCINKMIDPKNSTSRNYTLDGALGTFGIISSMTNPFCDSCNRIRLTADGKIKNCLFSQTETDLLKAFREGIPLEPVILEAIHSKSKERGGTEDFEQIQADQMHNRSMIAIGG